MKVKITDYETNIYTHDDFFGVETEIPDTLWRDYQAAFQTFDKLRVLVKERYDRAFRQWLKSQPKTGHVRREFHEPDFHGYCGECIIEGNEMGVIE